MKILHVVDPGSLGGGGTTLRLLGDLLAQRGPDSGDEVLLLGHKRHEALARRCGTAPIARLCPPRGLTALARNSIRSTMDAREAARGRYDLVHAWSLPAAALLALAAPSRPRAATIMLPPGREPLRPLMTRALNARPMPLLVPDDSTRRACLDAGLNRSLLVAIAPGVDAGLLRAEDRAVLRARWRVPEGAFVVGSFSEPVRRLDVRLAAAVIATLPHAGRDARLLVHPRARRRLEAARWLRALRLPECLVLDDACAEPWQVLPGLDAALFLEHNERDRGAVPVMANGVRASRGASGPERSGLMPLRWAMAAGVPVIAERCLTTEELVRHGEQGYLVRPGNRSAAAHHLLQLADDRHGRERMGRAARESALAGWSAAKFARRWEEAMTEGVARPMAPSRARALSLPPS